MDRRVKGFTLLETLVALFILAIIAIYLLPAFSKSMELEKEATEYHQKVHFAKEALERIRKNHDEGRKIDEDIPKLYPYTLKTTEEGGMVKITLEVEDNENLSFWIYLAP
ncbi:MAG: competence type IV pilus minor pilin ComGE [Tissierellia bacterium]|nr:competence type IV pilus minor pilin ComGE [Tissierellia bacterium]